MILTVKYSVFAIIAILVNILSQMFIVKLYLGAYSIEVSILAGTILGLLVKYYLDKRYIFYFEASEHQKDSMVFALYVFVSLFTTIIFWGTEYAFYIVTCSDIWRYIGGVLGLIVGYFIKFQLDKKYVFIKRGDHS